jgi:hypothetical protein
MSAIIKTLLNVKDNSEKIRDQIAAIIALECANQYALAQAAGASGAEDFNIAAYVENSRPWDLVGDKETSPFPLVNISLEKIVSESGSNSTNYQKFTGFFNVDCYGCGNTVDESGDDRNAAIKAWKVARIVRNIIGAGEYTYLGLRKVNGAQCVCSRKIEKIETGAPANMAETAIAVLIARMSLSVVFYESTPQADGVDMEPMTITCDDSTGKVLFNF